jgi:hypothetical protein
MRDDDQPITVVNRAKAQYTLADYELAQEEYRRKTQAREEAKRAHAAVQPAATATAKPDAASSASQIKQLLLRSDISADDRAMLERRLHEATMGAAFSQR